MSRNSADAISCAALVTSSTGPEEGKLSWFGQAIVYVEVATTYIHGAANERSCCIMCKTHSAEVRSTSILGACPQKEIFEN